MRHSTRLTKHQLCGFRTYSIPLSNFAIDSRLHYCPNWHTSTKQAIFVIIYFVCCSPLFQLESCDCRLSHVLAMYSCGSHETMDSCTPFLLICWSTRINRMLRTAETKRLVICITLVFHAYLQYFACTSHDRIEW